MKITLVIAFLLVLSGCGSLIIARECTKAQDRQEYVCKSLPLWE